MYVCGPTVYQRDPHRERAAFRRLLTWLASWLRELGYEVTFVHNITDVNDKIYDAAPGASAELARDATRWYLRGHGRPRARDARTRCRSPRETIPEIVALIEELVAEGYAYAVGGRRLLPRVALPEYGQSLGPAPRSGRGAGAERAQGGSARLRPLEGDARPARTRRGSRRGVAAGPAGTSSARPWPRRRSGPSSEIHGGGLDLRVPAPRERDRAVAGGRPSVRADLDAQRDARARRRRDAQVARQRHLAAQRARHLGARDDCSSSS